MAKQTMYGHSPGGIDPRTFSPDYELCTEQEIQNWKDDCAAWDRGENPEVPPAGQWIEFPDGTQMHMLAPRYGVGVYEYDDGEPEPEYVDTTPLCLACGDPMIWNGDEGEMEMDGTTLYYPIYRCINPDCNADDESSSD